MEENLNQYNQQGHTHSLLYFALGSSLGGGFLLLFVVGIMFVKGSAMQTSTLNSTASKLAQQKSQTTTSPTASSSSSAASQKITPVLIQNKKDLDNALKMYDNQAYASDTSVQQALDQNSSDLSSFSN